MKFILLWIAVVASAQDAKDIFRRAMERDVNNLAVRDTYMYERRTHLRVYDKDGRIKEDKLKLHEVFHVDGSEIERLLEKDGKPLSAKDQAGENHRVDREIEKIRKESPTQRAKRRGETDKDRREEIQERREVLDAFDFKLVGVDTINGRKSWGIRGTPRPGFQGRGRRADMMKKVGGVAWIHQDTYELARLEMESSDTISMGWFLFRLQPGAKFRIEQTVVNNEVLLPREVDIRADARLLGRMMRVGLEIRYGKFRKFSSDSKLLVGEQ